MPGENAVDITSGRLFPWPFLVLGAIFFLAGIGILTSYPIGATILLLLGALILTGYEGTEINPPTHTYREYNSFLFLKKGREKRYDTIERIFVNSSRVTQRIYTAHTTRSARFSRIEYNAYLVLGDGVKIFLLSKRNKNKLLQKLAPISQALNTTVIDTTLQKTS